MLAEKRALAACEWPDRPRWILAVRRATPEEDASGVDLVVTSDAGVLHLQVKSSTYGKARWLEKHGRRAGPVAAAVAVAVVVVHPSDDDARVRAKVWSALGELRVRRALDTTGGRACSPGP